jgi:hypothetical protein
MSYIKRLEVFEILEAFSKESSRKEKIKVLQNYKTQALMDVLRGTYDDSIQWNLPEGAPPFAANSPQSVPSTIHKQHRYFKYFVKGLRDCENLKSTRRESMFISILEAVHPEEAEVLVKMKDKKQLVKGLTKKLVEEAYPGLIQT